MSRAAARSPRSTATSAGPGRGSARSGPSPVVERHHRLPRAQVVDAGVVDDAVEPRAEGRLALEPGQGAERLDVGLLEDVVHAVPVAEEAEGQPPQPVVVVVDDLGEGPVVAPPGPGHDQVVDVARGGGGRHRPQHAAPPPGGRRPGEGDGEGHGGRHSSPSTGAARQSFPSRCYQVATEQMGPATRPTWHEIDTHPQAHVGCGRSSYRDGRGRALRPPGPDRRSGRSSERSRADGHYGTYPPSDDGRSADHHPPLSYDPAADHPGADDVPAASDRHPAPG